MTQTNAVRKDMGAAQILTAEHGLSLMVGGPDYIHEASFRASTRWDARRRQGVAAAT